MIMNLYLDILSKIFVVSKLLVNDYIITKIKQIITNTFYVQYFEIREIRFLMIIFLY